MASTSSLTFADLLRYHRTTAGLTQEELAEQAHLSVDAISTLERGARRTPRKDTVALLADALALAPEDRTVFAAAARRSPAILAATPGADQAHDGQATSVATELTHGIVTFLFADIEGSSLLLQQLGDDYAAMLAKVQELLHTIYLAHHGHELGAQGDRFFAVFAHPDDAVSAAVAAQRALAGRQWPEGTDVRLRMGIHTGSALVTAGRYVGLEVARAAHLAAAGHGGQVLLSHEAVDEVAKHGQEFPPGTELRYLGTHRLGDLRTRESIIQLMLPDTPGLPPQFPSLRTLDLWPVARANLVTVAMLTLVLLTLAGLALPLVVPTFPRALGWVAGAAILALFGLAILARPARASLARQWREIRRPFATIISVLLALVVVLTMLFITRAPILIASHGRSGYDFTYLYHRPTHIGGAITIGVSSGIPTLAPNGLGVGNLSFYSPIWQGCIVQLPDLTLGLGGWKADQCATVPTVDNGGESPDETVTTFRIDSRAVWSDGAPLTADDFLFGWRLAADPHIFGGSPFNQMTLTALDPHTVRIHWAKPYADYLSALWQITPVPLHAYATGQFAGIYNPGTGAYDSTIADRLRKTPAFNTTIPVDNGPFTVRDFVPDQHVTLVRNPRFFSNFFHAPALDQITLLSALADFPQQARASLNPVPQMQADVIQQYRQGKVALALGLEPHNLSQLHGVPKNEVVTSSAPDTVELGFNQRSAAPNAQVNGGVSIFTDRMVRQAFVEAFDRCAAVQATLGAVSCGDPNLFTDESDAVAPDSAYDPAFRLPAYNPSDAARLMEAAGYHLVDGVRRNKDGVTPLQIKLFVSPGASGDTDIAKRIQADYARNLSISVTVVNDLTLWRPDANPILSGDFDLLFVDGQSSPNPIGRLTWDFGPFDSADVISPQNPSGWNPFGIIDAQANQRDTLASNTPSDEQRIAILRSLQRYFSEQYYVEQVYIRANISLVKPTLCNFRHASVPALDLWNIADWYVSPTCP